MFASDRIQARSVVRCGLACVLVLCSMLSAHAADRDQEQVKRMKLQLRQLQQEQADAQAKIAADKAALEQSLKSTKSEASATKAAAAQATRAASSLRAELQTLKGEKTALTEQLAQLQKQLDDQKLAALTAADQARTQLAEQKGVYQSLQAKQDQCRQDNATLYQVGSDLLARYENKGMLEVFSASEPLVQTGRVKLENLSAHYRDKLEAARTQP